jgi:hypothetical protein
MFLSLKRKKNLLFFKVNMCIIGNKHTKSKEQSHTQQQTVGHVLLGPFQVTEIIWSVSCFSTHYGHLPIQNPKATGIF